ncbi:MAG TPA: glycoside hydrolase family 43 protein [Chloroflexaceae bacterium]|nr:glycoside hydrolase family 43 protein [Chloroflexaceae bacterium]
MKAEGRVSLARPLAVLLALLLGACGQGATVSPTGVPAVATEAPAAQAPTAAGPTPLPVPGPDEFVNPVINRDFPDPDLLKVGDTYYAYATNSGVAHVQGASSQDLVRWDLVTGVLPSIPPWARAGLTWAPEVTTWDDGATFVMYVTARDIASDKQCIGTATSDSPEGPFLSDAEEALICQIDEGGSIDAAAFRDDDGTPYLLWKNDGNCCGRPVYIYLQQVSPDGLSLVGEPTRLLTNDQPWEGNLIEAPTLWKHEGRYYLFYSANSYAGVDYAVGYAVADTITGPYTKPADEPLLSTDYGVGAALGPGGQDVVVAPDGATWLVYHSWDPSASYRRMNLDELDWEDGRPVVRGPDAGPQPRP